MMMVMRMSCDSSKLNSNAVLGVAHAALATRPRDGGLPAAYYQKAGLRTALHFAPWRLPGGPFAAF
jgi:hypothetical protein